MLEVNPNKVLINRQTVNLYLKYILSFFIYILFYLHLPLFFSHSCHHHRPGWAQGFGLPRMEPRPKILLLKKFLNGLQRPIGAHFNPYKWPKVVADSFHGQKRKNYLNYFVIIFLEAFSLLFNI